MLSFAELNIGLQYRAQTQQWDWAKSNVKKSLGDVSSCFDIGFCRKYEVKLFSHEDEVWGINYRSYSSADVSVFTQLRVCSRNKMRRFRLNRRWSDQSWLRRICVAQRPTWRLWRTCDGGGLKSQPVPVSWRAHSDRQIAGNISPADSTWRMEINFRWNWSPLFPLILKVALGSPAAGSIWSALIKRGALTWSITAFGGGRTPGEVLLFSPLLPLEYTAPS